MNDNTVALLVIALFVSAGVGAIIGIGKDKAGKGAVLGFLFGPIGWILMIFDAGFLIIAALVLAGIFLIIAGVRSDERDKDKMQEIQASENRANENTVSEQAQASPEPATNITPTSASTPRSIYPPGVDTPEQRRAYLLEWANERKKQRQILNEQ